MYMYVYVCLCVCSKQFVPLFTLKLYHFFVQHLKNKILVLLRPNLVCVS